MLSGNSFRNREWIFDVQSQLAGQFDKTFVLDYEHWASGQPNIDLNAELIRLTQAATRHEPYGVFAKSIGTVLAVQAIEQGLIKPIFLLFCGIPLGYIQSDYPQFGDVLENAGLPTTLIHNQNDPVGSSVDVAKYMRARFASAKYKFIETYGNTHDYEDYGLIKAELTDLISQDKH